jgi:hypothetical protein
MRREFLAPRVKRPSIAAIVLALIPFIGICFSVSVWDRVTPVVMGLPFNLFWIMCWVVLTPALMAVAYRIEKRR